MSEHYYTSQPESESHPEVFESRLLNKEFQFTFDSGVFSKGRIDYGTKVLIDAAANEEITEGDFLDLGCGYGPIGLALASENPERTIHMVDINERAVNLSQKNALLNEIENVEIYSSSLYEKIEKHDFAAVVSNPPIRAGKKTVHAILEESYDYLTEQGKLFIVIQKKQGAPSAKKKMAEVFGNVERIALDNGYWILMSEK